MVSGETKGVMKEKKKSQKEVPKIIPFSFKDSLLAF